MKEYTLNDKSKNEIQGFITTQKESAYPTGNQDEKTEGKLWIVICIHFEFQCAKKNCGLSFVWQLNLS